MTREAASQQDTATTQRLDRWLWCVRLFRTRSLAAEAVRQGRIEVNGARAKPAKMLRAGDVVAVRRPPYVHELRVLGVTPRRLAAPLARRLYQESAASIAARESLAERLALERVAETRRWSRLDKKERRQRGRLKRAVE